MMKRMAQAPHTPSPAADDSASGVAESSRTRRASISDWLEGARPHTWANAFAPVVAGVGAAAAYAPLSWGRAVLALVVAWALIVGVNFANDYSDGIRGTDDDRSGPQRLTGSGLVAPKYVKYAAFAAFGVAGVAGVTLSLLSAWWLIVVGVVCVAAAWFYTGGSNPYGYRGLGEVAVFIFFGLVAVLGTEFTQTGGVSWVGLAAAIGIGGASSAVNLANNLRDIHTDAQAGKITMAVRLGDFRTRMVWQILSALPIFASLFIAVWQPWALVGLIAVPLWVKASEPIRRHRKGTHLIPVLGATGRMMLLWSVVTALALALG